MNNGFVDLVYSLAPDYTVRMEVGYTTTKIQITSTRKSITKTSIFRLSDLPVNQNMDEYCKEQLESLVAAIKSAEE